MAQQWPTADIARQILAGFDDYRERFRQITLGARARFEQAQWQAIQQASAERINLYEDKVAETRERLCQAFPAEILRDVQLWPLVKSAYIGLIDLRYDDELAETWFNSIFCSLFSHDCISDGCMFVHTTRPSLRRHAHAAQTCSYVPESDLRGMLERILEDYRFGVPYEDLPGDVARLESQLRSHLPDWVCKDPELTVELFCPVLYRNKGAYLVGKIITGYTELAFAVPIIHSNQGKLILHAALFGEDDLHALFSFARAYFMVDMEVPSAYVSFLRSLMPRKPKAEIYNALGLAKQGKTLFYRDFLHHLRHSSDQLRIAPGIKGLVMLVFDLPSFPYVFKLVKDRIASTKETTRAQVKSKYRMVMHHDRGGRMADTMEYSLVAFPRSRFSDELLAELQAQAPSQIEISDRDGDGQEEVIISHLYIERRLVPLNLFLQECLAEAPANPARRAAMEKAVIEYGNAIKDLVATNIFPGDMLWKNFGVTRGGKVVFYDYDEIEYLTDCHFRAVPPPRCEEDELSGEVWWKVGPRDVFPETFAPFLLGNPAVREVFMRHHADLLTPQYWQAQKERIQHGHVHDVFPYPAERRFPAGAARA